MRPNQRLSDEAVVTIRLAYRDGATLGSLAEEYGVSKMHVCQIVRGRARALAGGPISQSNRHRAGNHTLTADEVTAMRQAYRAGEAIATLAETYDVTVNGAARAVFGLTWSHLAEPPCVPTRNRKGNRT